MSGPQPDMSNIVPPEETGQYSEPGDEDMTDSEQSDDTPEGGYSR